LGGGTITSVWFLFLKLEIMGFFQCGKLSCEAVSNL